MERLRQEALAHAEEDRKKKSLIETKNQAEQLVYTAEKSLREAEGKLTPEIKGAVQQKIEGVKSTLGGSDESAIKTALAELSAELQKVGQMMYTKEDGNQNPPDSAPQP